MLGKHVAWQSGMTKFMVEVEAAKDRWLAVGSFCGVLGWQEADMFDTAKQAEDYAVEFAKREGHFGRKVKLRLTPMECSIWPGASRDLN